MKKLWYKTPAKEWTEALPLGNGRLGAMVYGGVYRETLQLNEDSIWYGRHKDRHNPDALGNLKKIRRYINEEKFDKANQLIALTMVSVPETQSHYEPLGDMFVTFAYPDEEGELDVGRWANNSVMHKIKDYSIGTYENYSRALDLERGMVTVTYSVHGIQYTRTSFISYPDNALVVNVKSDKPGSIYVWAQISRQRSRFNDYSGKYDDKTLMMNGDGGKEGIQFSACLKTENDGGKMRTQGQYTVVEGADEVNFKLVADTTFRVEDPLKSCLSRLSTLDAMRFETLKDNHLTDYKRMYTRSSVEMEDVGNQSKLPTDERLKRIADGEVDPHMVGLYYEYAKYLTIACSRPGSLPANLQGIWNDLMKPPWDSKYTININAEMNYWPTDVMQLGECTKPFFDLIERMRKNGKDTAKRMYGCRGFTAHHNTDIWGDTAPQDACLSASFWVSGAAWMCTHIFEHYLFTKDKKFLEDMFVTMLEASLFLLDFMEEDKNGQMVTSPSMSPENSFITEDGQISALCKSPAMDFQIIRMLFHQCLDAADILGRQDNDIIKQIKKVLPKLPDIKIGIDGRIMEWEKEYEEKEKGHRHMSHLFALHPDCYISHKTPDLFKAARASLEYRLKNGGGSTGWSRAWVINFWARLLDSKKVEENVYALFAVSSYPNLFDAHPPFQIDGNFGGAAGIAEAILQSHSQEIYLLPALPKAWGKGKACGLRVRGGYTVDIEFDHGELVYADILSDENSEVKIRVDDDKQLAINGKRINKSEENLYVIKVHAGQKVRLENIK